MESIKELEEKMEKVGIDIFILNTEGLDLDKDFLPLYEARIPIEYSIDLDVFDYQTWLGAKYIPDDINGYTFIYSPEGDFNFNVFVRDIYKAVLNNEDNADKLKQYHMPDNENSQNKIPVIKLI